MMTTGIAADADSFTGDLTFSNGPAPSRETYRRVQ